MPRCNRLLRPDRTEPAVRSSQLEHPQDEDGQEGQARPSAEPDPEPLDPQVDDWDRQVRAANDRLTRALLERNISSLRDAIHSAEAAGVRELDIERAQWVLEEEEIKASASEALRKAVAAIGSERRLWQEGPLLELCRRIKKAELKGVGDDEINEAKAAYHLEESAVSRRQLDDAVASGRISELDQAIADGVHKRLPKQEIEKARQLINTKASRASTLARERLQHAAQNPTLHELRSAINDACSAGLPEYETRTCRKYLQQQIENDVWLWEEEREQLKAHLQGDQPLLQEALRAGMGDQKRHQSSAPGGDTIEECGRSELAKSSDPVEVSSRQLDCARQVEPDGHSTKDPVQDEARLSDFVVGNSVRNASHLCRGIIDHRGNAWILPRGQTHVVIDVDARGYVQLRNPRADIVSGWLYPGYLTRTSDAEVWGLVRDARTQDAVASSEVSTTPAEQLHSPRAGGETDVPRSDIDVEFVTLSGQRIGCIVPRCSSVDELCKCLRKLLARDVQDPGSFTDRNSDIQFFDLVLGEDRLVDGGAKPFAHSQATSATLTVVRRSVWVSTWDETLGRYRYYNTETGELSWSMDDAR